MGTHRFSIEGKDYEVQVGPRSGSAVSVTVNGKQYDVAIQGGAAPATPAAASPPAAAPPPPVSAPAPAAAGGSGEIVAPISGVVLSVNVSPGDSVQAGDIVLVLEAMKMENEIFAPCTGTVEAVDVRPQQEINQGARLMKITPAG